MGTIIRVQGVKVVHWNPHRSLGKSGLGLRLALGTRYNNFGDLLGPQIVSDLASALPAQKAGRKARLLAVGSILHFARTGDTIWGIGLNGKVPTSMHAFGDLDVRAVRGPRTREFLQQRGIKVPEVYGDPALLLPLLRPDLVSIAAGADKSGVLIVPNLHDRPREELQGLANVLDPTSPVESCLQAIARSEFVASSSLHGIIIAEALGIPAVLVHSPNENPFKYEDYFLGTGRKTIVASPSFRQALSGGEPNPAMDWDARPLIDAFPSDLWTGSPA